MHSSRDHAAWGLVYAGVSLLASFLAPVVLLASGSLSYYGQRYAIALAGPAAVALLFAVRIVWRERGGWASGCAVVCGLASGLVLYQVQSNDLDADWYLLLGPAASILASFLIAKAAVEWKYPPRRWESGVVAVSSLVVLPLMATLPTFEPKRPPPMAWPILALAVAVTVVWVLRWTLDLRRTESIRTSTR